MIRSVLLKVCFEKIKANLYVNELNSRGIYAFIANENTSDIIPLGGGGYEVHVDIDKLDEALTIIEKMDKNYEKEEDFREATQEDIAYEKLKHERSDTKKSVSMMSYLIVGILIAMLLIVFISRNKIL